MTGEKGMSIDKKNLKEEVVHGTVKFPLAVYRQEPEECGEENTGEDFSVPLHWHEETEIIYLKKGKFRVDINMRASFLEEPALVFVNAGDIHAIRGEAHCHENAVVFDMNMLSFEHYDGVQYQMIRPLLDKKVQFPLMIDWHHPVWEEMMFFYEKMMEEAVRETPASRLRVKAYLLQMIATLYDNGKLVNMYEETDYDSRNIQNVKKVLKFIRQNYHTRITNEHLADMLNMNSQYFCRYFRKLTGKTPTEYINEIRIDKAAELLQQTDRKILDIAMECGYDNIGYFIRRFKTEKGITPSEYRKAYK